MAATNNPDLWTVVWNAIPFTGYIVDGDAVTASRNAQSFTLRPGIGGGSVRVKSGDKSGVVTVVLTEASETNALLSAASLLDERDGSGVGPFSAKNLSGGDSYSAERAWIQKPANGSLNASTPGTREWTFETDNLTITNGGIPIP